MSLPRLALIVALLGGCREDRSRPSEVHTPSAPGSASAPPGASASAPPTPSSPPPSPIASAMTADAGPCPTASVKVRNTAMAIKTARAYGFAGLSGSYVLVLSTKDVSCSALLSGARPVAKDEDYVEIGVGPSAIQQFVNADNESAKVRPELVKAPAAIGEPIAICVRPAAHLDTSMRFRSSIDVEGLVRGTYCGTVK